MIEFVVYYAAIRCPRGANMSVRYIYISLDLLHPRQLTLNKFLKMLVTLFEMSARALPQLFDCIIFVDICPVLTNLRLGN